MGDSLKQMILYGSYARGDYGDNSDMDIMVFVLFLNSHNIRFLSLILSLPNSYKTIVAIHFRTIFLINIS